MDYNSFEDDSSSPFPLSSDQPVAYDDDDNNNNNATSFNSGHLPFFVGIDQYSSVNPGISSESSPYETPFPAQTRQDDGPFDTNYSSSFSTLHDAYSKSTYSTSVSTLASWRNQPSSIDHATSFSASESSGLQSSFIDGSSPLSFIDYSESFSTQNGHSSFVAWPEYDGIPDYDRNTSSLGLPSYKDSIQGLNYRARLADISPSSAISRFDVDTHSDNMLSQLRLSVTDNTIRIIQTISQNIQDTIDDGLAKRRGLSAKINRLRQEIDGSLLPTAVNIKQETSNMQENIPVEPAIKDAENRRRRKRGSGTTARKVTNRRVAHINPQYSQTAALKPPRRSPYKTDEEHETAVKEYQTVFKKRHQVEGYEILYSFTEDHLDRLMGRLTECNLMETTANDFLEGRAMIEQCVLLLEIEGFIEGTEKDLKEVLECFAQLNDVSL